MFYLHWNISWSEELWSIGQKVAVPFNSVANTKLEIVFCGGVDTIDTCTYLVSAFYPLARNNNNYSHLMKSNIRSNVDWFLINFFWDSISVVWNLWKRMWNAIREERLANNHVPKLQKSTEHTDEHRSHGSQLMHQCIHSKWSYNI